MAGRAYSPDGMACLGARSWALVGDSVTLAVLMLLVGVAIGLVIGSNH